MKNCFRSFLPALCCLLFVLIAARQPARADMTSSASPPDRNIKIDLVHHGKWDGDGFYPVRISIKNDEDKDSQWIVKLQSNQVAVINAPKKKTTAAVIFLPDIRVKNGWSYSLPLFIQDRSGNSFVQMHISTEDSFNSGQTVLCSSWLPYSLINNLDTSSYVRSPNTTTLTEWPADWRVYSTYNRIIISGKDYQDLDPARKNALKQWAAAGGILHVISIDAHKGSKGDTSESRETIGWGMIDIAKAKTEKDAETYLKDSFKDLHSDVPLPDFPSSADEYQLNTPSGLLILALIVFAVLVGPITLFVWAPVNKRHRLFIFVPCISLAFSALLLLLILVVDGFGGEGMRAASIFLNPETNSAITHQKQICKTSVLVNSSFELDENALFSSRNMQDEYSNSRGYSENSDYLREGSSFRGKWFASRSTLVQDITLIKPTRARISLAAGDGNAPVVQSTAPCMLTGFIYQDKNGVFWTADSVPPGVKTTLTRSDKNLKQRFQGASGYFNASAPANELAPVDTLGSIKWTNENVFFFGPVVQE